MAELEQRTVERNKIVGPAWRLLKGGGGKEGRKSGEKEGKKEDRTISGIKPIKRPSGGSYRISSNKRQVSTNAGSLLKAGVTNII